MDGFSFGFMLFHFLAVRMGGKGEVKLKRTKWREEEKPEIE